MHFSYGTAWGTFGTGFLQFCVSFIGFWVWRGSGGSSRNDLIVMGPAFWREENCSRSYPVES